jgi:hypothetical protein
MAGLEGLFNLVFVDMGAGGLTVIVFQLLIGSASCGGVAAPSSELAGDIAGVGGMWLLWIILFSSSLSFIIGSTGGVCGGGVNGGIHLQGTIVPAIIIS